MDSEKVDIYYPSEETKRNAVVKEYEENYLSSISDIEEYWDKEARQLSWYKTWDTVLDKSNHPFYKWFVGGEINIIHNAIDRHLDTELRNKIALIWEGEPGDVRFISYFELNLEVSRMANILKMKGVKPGDIVAIYLPQIPELLISMLACAKIGAMHSVVYAGFSSAALSDRISDAKSKLLITADGGWRRGKIIQLKKIVDKALEMQPTNTVECVVVKRTKQEINMRKGLDHWYHDLLQNPQVDDKCETVKVSSEHPLFILYTSGTTGKPKGVLHTHGGYGVYVSSVHRTVFDIKPKDRWWCLADPGWITGHSFVVYAPLINGATTLIYEGAPNYPEPDRVWGMVEKYGINILYTSPTAIRGLQRYGDSWVDKHDLSSLRLLGTVGEPINPAVWRWFYEKVGGERCPIMDTWWQSETGGLMVSPYPITPLKPGSATKPLFGIEIGIVDPEGNDVGPNKEGILVIKQPWPGMSRTIYGDPERFKEVYWEDYKEHKWYKAGDFVRIDEDGYLWVIGRLDDVIKVSGYRLGTAEIESAIVSHDAVVESAVIPLPDEIRGNAIGAYVVLFDKTAESEELKQEIITHVRNGLGPIAMPKSITFIDKLPKTRSGKVMRRMLLARALGEDEGDTSTLDD